MIIILILILIILLIVIGCFIYIKVRVENFSKRWFGTKDLFEGINNQKIQMEETPKTPYGIDSLILPEISKDFPYLNVNEMKKIAENSILLSFKSVETRKIQNFKNASEKMLNDMQSIIYDLNEKGDKLSISNIKMHKTVINKYDREESKCRLVFQTAVGYKVLKNGETKRYEDRINTEFIYVYNYKDIESNEAISLKCPNCGGPIQHLGIKTCPYCNSGLIDIASKTWKLNDIKHG